MLTNKGFNMKSSTGRIALSLFLAASMATSCKPVDVAAYAESAKESVYNVGEFLQETGNSVYGKVSDFVDSKLPQDKERRKQVKKVAIVSAAVTAAIISAYCIDKYGVPYAGHESFFAGHVDAAFAKVFGGMLALCGLAGTADGENDSSVEGGESNTSTDASGEGFFSKLRGIVTGWYNQANQYRKENHAKRVKNGTNYIDQAIAWGSRKLGSDSEQSSSDTVVEVVEDTIEVDPGSVEAVVAEASSGLKCEMNEIDD